MSVASDPSASRLARRPRLAALVRCLRPSRLSGVGGRRPRPPGSWLLLQNHGHHTSTHQVMKVNARHTTPTSRTAQLQLYSTVFGIVKLPALLMNVMIFTLHRTSAHRKRGHAIAHRGLDPQLHAPGVVHRNQSASTLPVCSLTDASLAMCDDWFCMLHMFHMPVASKCSPRRRPATDRNHD